MISRFGFIFDLLVSVGLAVLSRSIGTLKGMLCLCCDNSVMILVRLIIFYDELWSYDPIFFYFLSLFFVVVVSRCGVQYWLLVFICISRGNMVAVKFSSVGTCVFLVTTV